MPHSWADPVAGCQQAHPTVIAGLVLGIQLSRSYPWDVIGDLPSAAAMWKIVAKLIIDTAPLRTSARQAGQVACIALGSTSAEPLPALRFSILADARCRCTGA